MHNYFKSFIVLAIVISWIFSPGWAAPAANSSSAKKTVQTTKVVTGKKKTKSTTTASKNKSTAKKVAASKTAAKKPTAKKLTKKKTKPTTVTTKVTTKKPASSTRLSTTPVNQNALDTSINATHADAPPSLKQRTIDFVHRMIGTLHHSSYKLGGSYFDTVKGVYILDCSRYVNRILQAMYPHAYSNLVHAAHADKPNSEHYYDFFTNLSNGSTHYWDKIEGADELEAGDILVFRYKNSLGHETGGHVMIVMNKPIRDDDVFLVRVTDSAGGAHSNDTRKARTSGIGIGTLLLKVDPRTEHPYAFAWRIGSRWKQNVNIAMARPVDIQQF
jgi:cell wall-associated NlpC family hydrolase